MLEFFGLGEAAKWITIGILWAKYRWSLLVLSGAAGLGLVAWKHTSSSSAFSLASLRGVIVSIGLLAVIATGMFGLFGLFDENESQTRSQPGSHFQPTPDGLPVERFGEPFPGLP